MVVFGWPISAATCLISLLEAYHHVDDSMIYPKICNLDALYVSWTREEKKVEFVPSLTRVPCKKVVIFDASVVFPIFFALFFLFSAL